MSVIRVTCEPASGSKCIEPTIRSEDMKVVLLDGSPCYRFTCPECHEVNFKHNDARAAHILINTGVEIEVVQPYPITAEGLPPFEGSLPDPSDFTIDINLASEAEILLELDSR